MVNHVSFLQAWRVPSSMAACRRCLLLKNIIIVALCFAENDPKKVISVSCNQAHT